MTSCPEAPHVVPGFPSGTVVHSLSAAPVRIHVRCSCIMLSFDPLYSARGDVGTLFCTNTHANRSTVVAPILSPSTPPLPPPSPQYLVFGTYWVRCGLLNSISIHTQHVPPHAFRHGSTSGSRPEPQPPEPIVAKRHHGPDSSLSQECTDPTRDFNQPRPILPFFHCIRSEFSPSTWRRLF